jgi:hypothetical protein
MVSRTSRSAAGEGIDSRITPAGATFSRKPAGASHDFMSAQSTVMLDGACTTASWRDRPAFSAPSMARRSFPLASPHRDRCNVVFSFASSDLVVLSTPRFLPAQCREFSRFRFSSPLRRVWAPLPLRQLQLKLRRFELERSRKSRAAQRGALSDS